MSSSPFRFLHFSASLRRINKRYKLADQKEVLVLEAVLAAYAEKVNFSVLDLILLNEIASQATLHSVMSNLITKKLIKAEASKQDRRRKYVAPTKLAHEWLHDCSDLLCSTPKK
jgi:DNA-binding MarR family transcriptional regulator